MLLNSFSSKQESLSLAFCGTHASCNIIICLLKSLCSHWKLEYGGMVGISVGHFLILSCNFSVLVHDILLTSILSFSITFNVLNAVALGMCTPSYAVLSMGILSKFRFLWLILWSTSKGMGPKRRSSLASRA